MAKLTYDQMSLVESEPPIDLKKRNPYKVYAQFIMTEPVEAFNIEDLRELLHNVSDDIVDDGIDIMLVFKPGTNDKSQQQYQVWIAAPKEIVDKLNCKFVEARNFIKLMHMFHHATKCQYMMLPSLQEMTVTNEMAYNELTKQIGVVDSVVPRYTFNTSFENVKKILEVMATTGHAIHDIVSPNHTSKMDFGFGFALDASESDQIYFHLLYEDKWEVQIYASTLYCHFLKVVEIVLPGTIISRCVKSHVTSDDSYSKCETIQKYIHECIKKSYGHRTLTSVAAISRMQQCKIKELIDRSILCAYFDDEKTCTDRIKVFIDSIIEAYSGSIDVSIKFILESEKYGITIELTDNIRTRLVPRDDNKWIVEIFSPEMIALYSVAVNESISELFPECKQDKPTIE